MISAIEIRKKCIELAPMLTEIILDESESSNATWHGDISNGKALEILAISSLMYSCSSLNLELALPELFLQKPNLFYLQNTIPLSNPITAGHSSDSMSLAIEDRFASAFTPKFFAKTGERTWSVYKEGVPSIALEQYISGAGVSSFRPDIAILEGNSSFEIEMSILNFKLQTNQGASEYSLRMLDAPEPRIVDFNFQSEHGTRITGLIECSVNKGLSHLESQLNNYLENFGPNSHHEICYFYLNGKEYPRIGCNFNATNLLDAEIRNESSVLNLKKWLKRTLDLGIE